MSDGWSQTILARQRGGRNEIPMIVRADGTNNGAWFKDRHMWLQNEDTGGKQLPTHMESRSYATLLDDNVEPPGGSP